MKQKHIMEFFRDDNWRVRLAVFVLQQSFWLALVALCIWGTKDALPASFVTLVIKKFM